MVALIIFLLFFASIIILFVRLKIKFHIEIVNFNIHFEIIVLNKKISGEFLLKKQFNEKYCKKNKTKRKHDYKRVFKAIKYIEIAKLDINIIIGLILMEPTIISIPALSIIITYLYNLPFKKKDNLSFTILPSFETLNFNARLDGIIKINLLNIARLLLVTSF